jgi:hypothetical protein
MPEHAPSSKVVKRRGLAPQRPWDGGHAQGGTVASEVELLAQRGRLDLQSRPSNLPAATPALGITPDA